MVPKPLQKLGGNFKPLVSTLGASKMGKNVS